MWIYTGTVACVFNFLIVFSLFCLCFHSHLTLSLFLLSPHLTPPFPHLLLLSPLPPVKPCLHCHWLSTLHYRRSSLSHLPPWAKMLHHTLQLSQPTSIELSLTLFRFLHQIKTANQSLAATTTNCHRHQSLIFPPIWLLSFISGCLISGFQVEWGWFGFRLGWMGFRVFGLIWLSFELNGVSGMWVDMAGWVDDVWLDGLMMVEVGCLVMAVVLWERDRQWVRGMWRK